MNDNGDDFFAGKRPWSVIKDQVLRDYMSPYLAKVSRLGQPILLIDAYAGPGMFEDGQAGSPYIMCQAAEKYAKNNYTAIFFNKDEKYHKRLEQVLQKEGWSASAHPYLGDSHVLLQMLPPLLKNHTVFLYLDPFGLRGCEFSLLEPFLQRSPRLSTEILLTMSMPVVHRLAACHTEQESQQVKSTRTRLTKVFGGDYWRDILCNLEGSAKDREIQLIEAYRNKLSQYLSFTGSCPVQESIDKRIKYFIVFASRHKDAMILLNDIMSNAYFTRMHKAEYSGTLFEDFHWREMPSMETQFIPDLKSVILDTVMQHPGITRQTTWLAIIQQYFMRYLKSDYLDATQRLVDEKQIHCPTPHKTKRLNDECRLYPI